MKSPFTVIDGRTETLTEAQARLGYTSEAIAERAAVAAGKALLEDSCGSINWSRIDGATRESALASARAAVVAALDSINRDAQDLRARRGLALVGPYPVDEFNTASGWTRTALAKTIVRTGGSADPLDPVGYRPNPDPGQFEGGGRG